VFHRGPAPSGGGYVEFRRPNGPRWNTISISGHHIREAGATALQELGVHPGRWHPVVQSRSTRARRG